MDYKTGNKTTDRVAELNITGNVIPPVWFRTVVNDKGKPNLLAIMILSEVVYWYRPVEVRDEQTGQFIGYRKKFKQDTLQKSYKDLAEYYQVTKRQVTDAVVALEKIGVIKREFRTIEQNGIRYNNVLFIHLDPDVLKSITYPAASEESEQKQPPKVDNVDNSAIQPPLSRKIGTGSHEKKGEPIPEFRETNTEITKETTKDISPSVCLKGEPTRETDKTDPQTDVEDAFKKQIGYEALSVDYSTQPEALNILDLMVDLVGWIHRSNKPNIFVFGEKMSRNVACGILHRMDMFQAKTVVKNFLETKTEIRNLRSYMIAAMVNTVRTWSVKSHNEVKAKEAAWYETV